MIIRIPKLLLILLALITALIIYWPSMNGQPIWDDLSFLFGYNVIVTDFPFSTIWRDFGWPVSVSLHKLLFNLWHYEYFNFHLLNFSLHFLNSILILNIAEKLKLPFARLLFVFFLLHPANVISVSWMIQFKTLLCLFFALISFLLLTKAEANKKWFILSWMLFALSLLSKSSSIALPIFFFFYLRKKLDRSKMIWLLPFFLMSLISGWRIIKSPVTTEAVGALESRITDTPQVISAERSSNTLEGSSFGPEIEASAVYPTTIKEKISPWQNFTSRLENVLTTIHYYFWQTLLPTENAPVKGLKYDGLGMVEIIHILFILIVLIINWGTPTSSYLILGHLMLLPFMGLMTAPYMNLTWVSDQHLYLALPFFICFWLALLDCWKWKYSRYVPLLLIPIYIYKVSVTTPYYRNEVDFYSASLNADPLNVPIAYNLAITYLKAGDVNQAMNVTSSMVSMSRVAPEVLSNQYFRYIYILDLKLQDNPEEDKKNEN